MSLFVGRVLSKQTQNNAITSGVLFASLPPTDRPAHTLAHSDLSDPVEPPTPQLGRIIHSSLRQTKNRSTVRGIRNEFAHVSELPVRLQRLKTEASLHRGKF